MSNSQENLEQQMRQNDFLKEENLNQVENEDFFGLEAGPIFKAGVHIKESDVTFAGLNVGQSAVKLGYEADNFEAFTGLDVASVAKIGIDVDKEDKEIFTGLNVASLAKVGVNMNAEDKELFAGLDVIGEKIGPSVSFDNGMTAGVKLGPAGKVGVDIIESGSNSVRLGVDLGPLGNVGLKFPKLWPRKN
ncbi:hypothetical protein PVAND_001044 [Polypedilum vanderplanki]|uniref:Uncharacterized protein n=1 Tax=Polypedilum vanderplanki TaxID=319348 RepID=A0A9J6BN24_POLVA|nr:hypothetical protein PVAND_001044 [Polypedilum vanderplanki]